MKNIIQTLSTLSILFLHTIAFAQGSINVSLETVGGDAITSATVTLTDANGQETEITSQNGYTFSGLQPGNYTITVEKNLMPHVDVSGFDAALLLQHILGVRPLESPYQIIAADISNDQLVSILDYIEIRDLILFLITDMSSPSWKFIDKDYVFPNPNNPWQEAIPYKKKITLNGTEEVTVYFIGIKIGDLNQ